MATFTELEKGTLVKDDKEYDYAIEIADDFPKIKGNNIRIKIFEERPVIRNIRTRYDPDIFIEGDAGSSMELRLGYDMKEIKKAFKQFIVALATPFYITGLLLFMFHLDKLPTIQMPYWLMLGLLLVGGSLVLVLGYTLIRSYARFVMMFFAEYLKARDIKKTLDQEGFTIV